jgi:hypothetical protein
MTTTRLSLTILLVVLGVLAFTSLAHAQATRTWVSGVGDDANPCSRTAPCKTFAGAISKTAVGGEINCLDPGGFGAVTITKAITLNCEATLGSILAAGTFGITVNVTVSPATAIVRIIHLKILGFAQGTSPGTNGINYIAGKQLIVEDTKIYDFGTSCINANGAGLQVSLINSTLSNCNTGLVAQAGAHAVIRNSTITNNNTVGVQAGPGTGIVNVDNSNVSFNATGLRGSGANSFVNIANTLVSFNSVQGTQANGGGITTFADCAAGTGFTNLFVNNAADGNIPSALGVCLQKK